MEHTIHWIDFVPLGVFAWGARLAGLTSTEGYWSYAFYMGSTIALLQIVYYWCVHHSFDYIALGCDLFLFVGAFGYAFYPKLLEPYVLFKESTIFVWIFFIGAIAAIVSPKGFIQLRSGKPYILRGSLALLGLTLAALGLSVFLLQVAHLGTGLGVGLPFIGLLSLRAFLRNYCHSRTQIS